MTYWPNEKIIELVKVFEEKECLWNPNHAKHKCRLTTSNAWSEVSQAMGNELSEVKRKMKNLMGQFHRECKRYEDECGVVDQACASKWFAYKHLLFLKGRYKGRPRQLLGRQRGCEEGSESSRSENENGDNGVTEEESESQNIPSVNDMKIEIHHRDTGEQATMVASPGRKPPGSSISIKRCPPVRPSTTNFPKKLKISAIHSRAHLTRVNPTIRQKRVDNIVQNHTPPTIKARTVNVSSGRDVNDIFGELVACKMKNLRTDYARTTVEHIISNVLWEASLGKYDYPSTIREQSPSETPCSPLPHVDTACSSVVHGHQGNCVIRIKDNDGDAIELLEIDDGDTPEEFH